VDKNVNHSKAWGAKGCNELVQGKRGIGDLSETEQVLNMSYLKTIMRNARTVQCLFIMNVDTRENCYLSKQELLVKIYTI
jgi:hypothetical protein